MSCVKKLVISFIEALKSIGAGFFSGTIVVIAAGGDIGDIPSTIVIMLLLIAAGILTFLFFIANNLKDRIQN